MCCVALSNATVLLSGGVDSAVVLALLSSGAQPANAVWIHYGQPAASAERQASKVLAAYYGATWAELVVTGLAPPTAGEFPGRNDMLIALAAASAPGRCLAIGVHAGTSYADCSPSWLGEWQRLLTVEHYGTVRLLAPLADLSKAQVYALAGQCGIPVGLTHSCETSVVPCGTCLSCKDRQAIHAGP